MSFRNFHSDRLVITSGVSQGSSFGPLLFILYITDIIYPAEISGVKLTIYTDDTIFFSSHYYVCTSIATTQEVVKQITTWTLNNKLKLNCKKTKAILFNTRNKRINVSLHLTINNEQIELVNCFKILGVFVFARYELECSYRSCSSLLSLKRSANNKI